MKNKITSLILISWLPILVFAQTPKTEVLILGTSHLSQVNGVEPSMLNTVINNLNSLNFDVVCIEKMPGQLLYDIESRNDSTFDAVIDGGWGKLFLSLADTVQKVKNITSLDAEHNIELLLETETLSAPDRKELFYNFLAATDLPSAALQYQYLKRDSYLFTSDFDNYLVDVINRSINTHNEYYTLALPLAFYKHLNKIDAIDNFQDEALLMKYYPDFIQDYQQHADELNATTNLPVFQKIDSLTKQGVKANDLSELYSFINSSEYITQDYNAQWKIWLNTNFLSGSDRARFSLWEMRNLQIAANIMNVVSRHPGKRIVVIIGSSHKGFLEKYLRQMEDIELLKYE